MRKRMIRKHTHTHTLVRILIHAGAAQDLTDLGVKLLDPSVFASSQFCHTATAQLQRLLLKLGLLLGVTSNLPCPPSLPPTVTTNLPCPPSLPPTVTSNLPCPPSLPPPAPSALSRLPLFGRPSPACPVDCVARSPHRLFDHKARRALQDDVTPARGPGGGS